MVRKPRKSVDRDSPKETQTLEAFIRENYQLVSVFGIFIAVASFASNLPLKGIGAAISILFLISAMLVWLELWRKFPPGKPAELLFWFEHALVLITVAIVGYWLLLLRELAALFILVTVAFLVLGAASGIIKQGDLFNRLFRAKPGQRTLLRYLFGFVVIGLSIFAASLIATLIILYVLPPVTSWFATMNEALQHPFIK